MAVAIVQTANPAGVSASGNVATYSGVSIGTASPDRLIVVCIGKEVASLTVSSVTIDDGSGAKPMDAITAGVTFGSMGAWMYRASCPTGTTATVAVTWSGNPTDVQNHIAVYALTDAAAPPVAAVTDTSTDMDVTSPLNAGSITIVTNGGALAVAACAVDTVGKTWANLTEDIDADVGDFRFTTAMRTAAGTVTPTVTGGTNAEDGVLIIAVFNPSRQPEFVQSPMQPGTFRR